MLSVGEEGHQRLCDVIGFSVALGFAPESGQVLADARVSGLDGGGVLLGGQMLQWRQHLGVDRIVIGMKDGALIPRDMRHQLAERFGGAIANSRGDLPSGTAINSQP